MLLGLILLVVVVGEYEKNGVETAVEADVQTAKVVIHKAFCERDRWKSIKKLKFSSIKRWAHQLSCERDKLRLSVRGPRRCKPVRKITNFTVWFYGFSSAARPSTSPSHSKNILTWCRKITPFWMSDFVSNMVCCWWTSVSAVPCMRR